MAQTEPAVVGLSYRFSLHCGLRWRLRARLAQNAEGGVEVNKVNRFAIAYA